MFEGQYIDLWAILGLVSVFNVTALLIFLLIVILSIVQMNAFSYSEVLKVHKDIPRSVYISSVDQLMETFVFPLQHSLLPTQFIHSGDGSSLKISVLPHLCPFTSYMTDLPQLH